MSNLFRHLRDLVVMSEVITQVLATGILAVGGFLLSRLWVERVHVRRLKSSDDKDFDAFYDICRANFVDDELEPQSEMARYLDEGQNATSERPFEDYFAVLKRGSEVCGVINATIYRDERLGFINYVALDEENPKARQIGSLPLLKALGKRLRTLRCRAVLYEIETLRGDVLPHDNEKSVTRAQRFVKLAAKIDARTYEVPINYAQPELSVIEGYRYAEVPLSLMYVTLDGAPPPSSRKDLAELLRVVFLKWYLDIYDAPGSARDRYESYLSDTLKRVVTELGDDVFMREARRGWRPPLRSGGGGTPATESPKGVSPARRRRLLRAKSAARGR